jgi:hypothetical protein
MDEGKIKRKPRSQMKSVLISIRITPELSKWLREKDYSPTSILHEAVKELGYKEKDD